MFHRMDIEKERVKSMENKEVTSRRPQGRFVLRLATLFVVCSALVLATAGFFFLPNSVTRVHAATWTQIWNEDFNGAAGTGINSANWFYDTGTGFGTGEI